MGATEDAASGEQRGPAAQTALRQTLPVPYGPMAAPIDPGVDIGHVHLKVADLDRAIGFYRDVLGFDLKQQMGDQAAFLSAGGYHHHIGLNTWESKGGSPPPRGTTGLYHVAIRYPSRTALADALRRLVENKIPDLRRLRPRRQRGDLPQRPGRQWHRALPRPAAGGVADGPGRVGRGNGLGAPRSRGVTRRLRLGSEPVEIAGRERHDRRRRAAASEQRPDALSDPRRWTLRGVAKSAVMRLD